MLFAFSLRSIPFHQDNYSFQFDADNNSRCSCQVYFDLFGVFLQLSTASIRVSSAFELLKDNLAVKLQVKTVKMLIRESPLLNGRKHMKQWSRQWLVFRTSLIENILIYEGTAWKSKQNDFDTWDKSRIKLRSRMILAFSLRPISPVLPIQLFFSIWFYWIEKIIWSNDLDSDLFSKQV